MATHPHWIHVADSDSAAFHQFRDGRQWQEDGVIVASGLLIYAGLPFLRGPVLWRRSITAARRCVHGGARAVDVCSRSWGRQGGKLGLRFGRVHQHGKFQESGSDATSFPVNEKAASYDLLAHLK
jgi:hypothetical protein